MNLTNKLLDYIKNLGSVLVCYSGGTDSALLLHLAQKALGEKAQGIFFDSAHIPQRDREAVGVVGRDAPGTPQCYIKEFNIFSVPRLDTNPENRCYLCKHHILTLAKLEAERMGLQYVLEGSHADDIGQHRPGRKAVKELGILSPFEAVGLGKADIRRISREENLPTWDKPSYSCLLTRLPHNEPVLVATLRRIEALENAMISLGFRDFRVRHRSYEGRGGFATLELAPAEQDLLEAHRQDIIQIFNEYGYDDIEFKGR